MRISAALIVLSLVASLPVRSATAYSITVTSSLLRTWTYGPGGAVNETVNPTALPYSHTSTSTYASNDSETMYTLSNAGFDITFDHSRTGALGNYAQSLGSIEFSVDQNVDYVASGSYSTVDPDGGHNTFRGWLYDITDVSDIFKDYQTSYGIVDESFTLGDGFGYTGSLTGTLIAGHEYLFQHDASIGAAPTSLPSGATASGSISLSFTPAPEPGTGLLVMVGLLGFVGVGRSRILRN